MKSPQPFALSQHSPSNSLWLSRTIRNPKVPLGTISSLAQTEFTNQVVVSTFFALNLAATQPIEVIETINIQYTHDRRVAHRTYRVKTKVPPQLKEFKKTIRKKIIRLVTDERWGKTGFFKVSSEKLDQPNTKLLRNQHFFRTPVSNASEQIKIFLEELTLQSVIYFQKSDYQENL